MEELGFLNVRSVVALPMAQTVTVPLDEDQHTLPYFDRIFSIPPRSLLIRSGLGSWARDKATHSYKAISDKAALARC